MEQVAPDKASSAHNLPLQLTSFIGREVEIAEVTRLLAGTRLLTLTGTGGCGKTRLALQVASSLCADYPDGVWLVELAPLSQPALVPHGVASTLGVVEQPDRPLTETLAGYLRSKMLLLVLDNCEHLGSAPAEMADALLRAGSDLRILATSREGLRVAGEVLYPVPPLSVPSPQRVSSIEDVTRYEAVRLFVERAGAVQPIFRTTAENTPAIARLCRQLDGIPLAIELAAARVKVLAVEQIVARLDDRFRLLTGGSQTAVPRHQTLRSAMDWSYDLLSEQERALLRRLSVFAGGCTLGAVEAVCASGGLEPPEILDLLTQLVDKSLVQVEIHGGEARYRLLETVRQYGRTRLREAGETEETRRRHRDWYLALAERADSKLRGPEQRAWWQRLETENDNLRAALEWSNAERGRRAAGLRLAGALQWFWHMRGYFTEGHRWLEAALSAAGDGSSPARANALCGAGMLAWRLGEYERARTLLQKSLAMFRQQRDRKGTGVVLHYLAHVAQSQGDLSRAAAQFQKSTVLFREVRDRWGIGWSLYCLGGTMVRQGNHGRATPLFEESLAIFEEVGDTCASAYSMSGLGMIAGAQGDYKRATGLLEKSLAIARTTNDRSAVATTLFKLGQVVFQQGDLARAAALWQDSTVRRMDLGDNEGIALCLAGLARTALRLDQPERAARLLGATEVLRETIGAPLPPSQREDYEHDVASSRAALGENLFQAAWAEGRAMTLQQAVGCALTPLDASATTKGIKEHDASKRANLLTHREREVATLIAQGRTNRVIGAALAIAERTVDAHVEHILNKLGFTSRTQIAAWAVAQGLHQNPAD